MLKKTLVLGASNNPRRYSYLAINKLIANAHNVRAEGLFKSKVNGVKISNTRKRYKEIDTITLYLNKKNQPCFYDYIVNLNPKRVIFNPGTENIELENILTTHSIPFEKSCTLTLLATGQY